MPQFNILSAGFQIRIMLATAVLAVAVAALAPLVEQVWSLTRTQIARMIPEFVSGAM
jgi:flagellar biosynthesis protein FliR